MALTTATFSIFHFKNEQMRAIPLPENLGMFLKGEKSWEKINDHSIFCWEIRLFLLFWFLNICFYFKYPLKSKLKSFFPHTVDFIRNEISFISWNVMEIKKWTLFHLCFFSDKHFSSGLWKKTDLPLCKPKVP